MARIDEQIARGIAEASVSALLRNAGVSDSDAREGAIMLVDRAQEVSLTTAGVLVLRFDITEPKNDPDPTRRTEAEQDADTEV